MVQPSFDEEISSSSHSCPSTQDRFLAFGFDLVLLGPVISFLNALLLWPFRAIEASSYLMASSILGVVLWFWISSFCLVLWGATPGKVIMKMKVIPFDPNQDNSLLKNSDQLDWSSALLRTIVWLGGCFLLGIPFLSVFKDPKRRVAHDHWSRTILVTQKMGDDQGPLEAERQLARLLQRGSVVVLAIYAVVIGSLVLDSSAFSNFSARVPAAENESSVSISEGNSGCAGIQSYFSPDYHELDQLIVYFKSDLVSKECLSETSDKYFDKDTAVDRSWAALAKAVTLENDQSFFSRYLAESCRQVGEESEVCLAGKALATQSQPVAGTSLLSRWLREEIPSSHPVLSQLQDLKKDMIEGNSNVETSFNLLTMSLPKRIYYRLFAKVCLSQLTHRCEDTKLSLCEEHAQNMEAPGERLVVEESERWTDHEALAWIEYQKCRRTPRGSLSDWKSLMENRADIYQFAKVILGKSDGSVDDGKLLRIIEDSSQSGIIRSRALVQLVHHEQKEKIFKDFDFADSLQKIPLDSFQVSLLSSSLQQQYELRGFVFMKKNDSTRMPASIQEEK